MADDTEQGGQYQAVQSTSRAHSALDSGCPPEELAFYEGLEHLGRSSRRSEPLDEPLSSRTQPSDTIEDTEGLPPHNELINLGPESLHIEDRLQSSPQTELRDDGPRAQRPTPLQMTSSPSRKDAATELDMYSQPPIGHIALNGRLGEVHHQYSSAPNEQAETLASLREGPRVAETELDMYEASRRVGDEPLRGGGAGPLTPYHHGQPTNSSLSISSAAAASGDASHIYPADSVREESHLTSRNNSVVLPRWQPDAEVTYCPICSSQFSFFNRKHHCRLVIVGFIKIVPSCPHSNLENSAVGKH